MKKLVLAITLASLAALPAVAPAADRPRACPALSVSCPETITKGAPVTFTANVGNAPDDVNPTYEWVVSAGTVSSGLGTSSITVDTTGVPAFQELTATVEVGGLPEGCPRSASCGATPITCIFRPKSDEYGNLRWGDEKARLDNFAVELRNDPTAVGYLVGYGGRRSARGEASKRTGRAKDYLVKVRGIDAARVVTVDGGYREELTVELWAGAQGAQPPTPAPTVDPTEVIFVEPAPRRRARRR